MSKNRNKIVYILVSLVVFISCQPDDSGNTPPAGVKQTNEWIEDIMRDHYLWYEDIPASSSLNYKKDPENFYASMLSDKDGKTRNGLHYYYSTIESNSGVTKSDLSRTATYGLLVAKYGTQYKGREVDFGWVIYVLPGSPAEDAGLKRGDWIMGINSAEPNITDIAMLNSGGDAVFYLGKYDESRRKLISNGSVRIAAARIVEDNPIFFHQVYSVAGKKVGYLVYNHFTSGPDGYKDNTYNDQLKSIFTDFKNQGVNEFILDLRYNGGGLVNSARLLASYLAPVSALGNDFCVMEYNNKQRTKTLVQKFESQANAGAANLNLSKLYVIVSSNTASASEAVINTLIPYIGRSNIVLLGEQTEGKYVGAEEFKDDNYEWILHPITLYIYNANHKADYDDGFAPDVQINELVFGNTLYPLGDPDELLLNAAFGLISGEYDLTKSDGMPSSEKNPIVLSLDSRKNNGLIFIPED